MPFEIPASDIVHTTVKGFKPPPGPGFQPPEQDTIAHQAKQSEDLGWALVGGRPTGIEPETAGAAGAAVGGLLAAPPAIASAPSGVGPPLIEVAGIGLGYSLGKQMAHLWNKYAAGKDTAGPGTNAVGAVKDVVGGTAGAMAGMGVGTVAEGMAQRIATDPATRQAWEATIPGMAQKYAGAMWKGLVRAFGDNQGAGGTERARQLITLIGQQAEREAAEAANTVRVPGSLPGSLPGSVPGGASGGAGTSPAASAAPGAAGPSDAALGIHPAQSFGATPAEAMALRTTAPGAAEKVAGAEMGRPGIAKDLQASGVELSGATQMLTKDPVLLGLYDAQRKNPQTARIIARPVQRAMDQLQQRWTGELEEAAPGALKAGKEKIGGRLQDTIAKQKEFVEKGTGAPSDVEKLGGLERQPAVELRYQQARGGPDEAIIADNTHRELLKMKQEAMRPGGGPDPNDPTKTLPGGGINPDKFPKRLQDLLTDIQNGHGQLPLQYMRTTRTFFGESGGVHGIEPSNSPEYLRIYKPMTQDFEQDAQNAGGKAFDAWNSTQENAATWAARRSMLQRVHDAPDGLAAFEAMTAGDQKALSRWRAAHATLPADQKNDLVVQYMQDMSADPKTGRLDLARWVRNWGTIDKSIKAEIAPEGTRLRQVADRYFRIGQAAQESGWLNNFSNTAAGILYHDVVNQGGLETAQALADAAREAGRGRLSKLAGGAAELAKAPFVLTDTMKAQLLTDPNFIDMVNQAAKIKPIDAAGMAMHLDKLGAMIGAGKFGKDAQPALEQWLGGLQQRLDLMGGAGGAGGGGTQERQGTRTLPKPGTPTLQDRAKQGAKAAGMAPRPSGTRGAGSQGAPQG